jgi:hypothetical protein
MRHFLILAGLSVAAVAGGVELRATLEASASRPATAAEWSSDAAQFVAVGLTNTTLLVAMPDQLDVVGCGSASRHTSRSLTCVLKSSQSLDVPRFPPELRRSETEPSTIPTRSICLTVWRGMARGERYESFGSKNRPPRTSTCS